MTDGVDVGRLKIRSGTAKVVVDGVPDPAGVRFLVDGVPMPQGEFVSTEPIASQFEFCLNFPRRLGSGKHALSAIVEGKIVGPFSFDVEN